MSKRPAEIPFKFEIPVEAFWKAGKKGQERRIGGIISTESRDRQQEVVLQRGLDFSPFLQAGWFNDNHSKETTGIVGYPIKVEKTIYKGKPAHRVEGYLLPDYPRADEIWNLANSLQKTDRRLGFSVEGGVTRREHDGRTIAEAVVRNVAITNCPVNIDTGLEVLAKSMMSLEAENELANSQNCWEKKACCGRCSYKALTAGHAISNPGASPGEGFPLRVESAEEDPKVLTDQKRRIKRQEARKFLKSRYRGLSTADADRILNHVAAMSAG